MKLYSLLLIIVLLVACNEKKTEKMQGDAQNKEELVPTMRIEELPSSTLVVHNVRGDFKKHPEVIENLRTYLSVQEISTQKCVGIYPEDPDAIPGPELNWTVGFELTSEDVKIDNEVYKVEPLEGGTALVVESSIKNSAVHGLYCKVWLLEHNYVQIMPTRMVYHFDSKIPEEQSTTIIFPIKKRTRDIPIITNSTLAYRLTEK